MEMEEEVGVEEGEGRRWGEGEGGEGGGEGGGGGGEEVEGSPPAGCLPLDTSESSSLSSPQSWRHSLLQTAR